MFARKCSFLKMDAGLLYQNAVIKAKEALLLGSDRLQRIADADSSEEAMRLLMEAGYPAGGSFDEILFAAEREASILFKSCMTKGYGLELFLVMDDYHNAKVAAKSAYFGGSKEGYKPEGLLPIAVIEQGIEKQEYQDLPLPMGAAFLALDKLSAKEALYPSSIDISLDKAAFREIAEALPRAHKTIAEYFSLLADLKNISVAYRAGKAALPREKAAEMILPAGTLAEKDLFRIYDLGEEAAEKIAASRSIKEALMILKEGTTAYEVYADDALLSLLKKRRYDMFSPAPIAGLYLGKQREIKNVRLILARLTNGVDKEIIRKRMRELYV